MSDASSRAPRGVVKLNGQAVGGWASFEVDNNAFRQADTFRVMFVVSALPLTRGADWFSKQLLVNVEIFAGFPKNPAAFDSSELKSLIFGQADSIDYDPVTGVIELSGRDLTAKMIDTKTSEHFANQTASEIATALAQRHGLTPVVTATRAKAGDYYKDDYIQTTHQQSEWELLTSLANIEDFQLYVSGHELHFEPRAAKNDPQFVIEWDDASADRAHPVANITDLRFSRNLTISKGITVKIKTWNAKQKKGFEESFPQVSKGLLPGQSANTTTVYNYTIAGLSADEAQQRAQAIYKQLVAHEMRLTASLPADTTFTVGRPILVRGTKTAYDQTYYPESVTRTMSIADGYRMKIAAKNTSPALESAG